MSVKIIYYNANGNLSLERRKNLNKLIGSKVMKEKRSKNNIMTLSSKSLRQNILAFVCNFQKRT